MKNPVKPLNDSEWFDLERFVEQTLGYKPERPSEGTVPDLCLGDLGIEHTHIFRDSGKHSMKSHEQLCTNIVDLAKNNYHEAGGNLPLIVNVHFNYKLDINTKRRITLAAQIAKIIREKELRLELSPNCQLIESWPHNLNHEQHIPQEILYLMVEIAKVPQFGLWAPCDSATIPKLSINRLQTVISAKEEILLRSYSQNCEKLWLLISTTGGVLSSHFCLDDKSIFEHKFISSFTRIFLMDIKIHELLIQ